MRILFIPYGTDKAPATRYRVAQYIPYLKKTGIESLIFSAISGISTTLMINSPDFNMPKKLIYYIYIFLERLFRFGYISFIARKFDVIFLQRTTFPFKLELFLKFLNPNIIFDIDDAIYLPDKSGNDIITRIKKYIKMREVLNILNVSKVVIVENEYIKDFVSRYCPNVVKIPGPIDCDRFFGREKQSEDIVIGWIGSPATTSYLHIIDRALAVIAKKYKTVKFHFVGAGNYKNADIEIKRIQWKYENEVSDLQDFDIGIMPMPNDEWTRGKLGCKMLQYMAVGIPAVVSYTSTNAEIIQNAKNSFFAGNDKEWVDVLSKLIENRALRKEIGRSGRNTVLEKCSLENNVGKLTAIFGAINNKRKG